jgi:hypothetical protein
VNVGCVPKKVMWFAANAATQINNAQGFGFDIEVKNFSWKKPATFLGNAVNSKKPSEVIPYSAPSIFGTDGLPPGESTIQMVFLN